MKSADKKNVTSNEIQNVLCSVPLKSVSNVIQRNLYIIKCKNKTLKIWSELEPKEFYKSLKLKHK